MAEPKLDCAAVVSEVAALGASRLDPGHRAYASRYPGESGERQPVHTVYGGAHLFRSDTAIKLGELAIRSLEAFGGSPEAFAEAIEVGPGSPYTERIHARVTDKLKREAVEDFRIDFEDGFGVRRQEEEDTVAKTAADEVAIGMKHGTLPPFIGIRIKPLNAEFHARSLRTLGLFVATLLDRTGGSLPSGFVVTLPKIVHHDQVAVLADAFETIERSAGITPGSLRLELMIETTQSIIGQDGRVPLLAMVEAAKGRCVGAHFGVYDYTANCSITAHHQHMRHPACDFARHIMQVSLAGTGVAISDGATNIMPAPPHRAPSGGSLTYEQEHENREVVWNAWRVHYADIRHSLEHAFYQGWDLHPAQLPTRYAALYAFFLEGLESASQRLRNFIEKAAQATLSGDVFDDAATGQGLLNYFLRGLNCGAITEDEALRTGLTPDELRLRSFAKILEARLQRQA